MTVPAVTAIETLVDDTRVLMEIGDEMAASIDKFGIQNHPDGTGPQHLPDAVLLREVARRVCDRNHAAGKGTWAEILREEYREALAEDDPCRLRAELVQVAAVAALWVAALDRRQRAAEVAPQEELRCTCGGLLAAATGVCSVCGADPLGYYDDDFVPPTTKEKP